MTSVARLSLSMSWASLATSDATSRSERLLVYSVSGVDGPRAGRRGGDRPPRYDGSGGAYERTSVRSSVLQG
jgi:hypothetical protein